MADKSQFISGIYNYCDRWCERCAFTQRCGNYAFGKELEEVMDDPDGAQQLFYKHLDDEAPVANAFVDDLDEAEDADTAPEPEGFGEDLDHELRRESAKNHECVVSAKEYYQLVSEWLKAAGVTHEENGTPHLPPRQAAGTADDAAVQDALEVVLWFQYLIHVKLARAMSGMLDSVTGDEFHSQDANGTAKVALIGMDRSISAWSLLLKAVPSMRTSTDRLIRILTGIRREVEELLPDARAYVRPGFDTAKDHS
jgi:hypothetical protein